MSTFDTCLCYYSLVLLALLSQFHSSSSSNSAKPKLIHFHRQVELVPNISYVLHCIAQSGKKPILFSWQKNGHKLVKVNSNLKLDSPPDSSMSSLTFANLQPEDSGMYECRAENTHGSDLTSTHLLVKGSFALIDALPP